VVDRGTVALDGLADGFADGALAVDGRAARRGEVLLPGECARVAGPRGVVEEVGSARRAPRLEDRADGADTLLDQGWGRVGDRAVDGNTGEHGSYSLFPGIISSLYGLIGAFSPRVRHTAQLGMRSTFRATIRGTTRFSSTREATCVNGSVRPNRLTSSIA